MRANHEFVLIEKFQNTSKILFLIQSFLAMGLKASIVTTIKRGINLGSNEDGYKLMFHDCCL